VTGVLGTLAWFLLAAPTVGLPPSEGRPVESRPIEHGRRWDAVLPGALVGYAVPHSGSDRRSVVLLVRPAVPLADEEEGEDEAIASAVERGNPPCHVEDEDRDPRQLWEWRLDPSDGTAPSTLTRIRGDLSSDAVGLRARDLNGDGFDELLVIRPGELQVFPGSAAGAGRIDPVIGLSKEQLDARTDDLRHARFSFPETGKLLPIATLGRTRFFRPRADPTAAWEQVAELETPLRHRRRGGRIRVDSVPLVSLGRDEADREVFASWPQTVGTQRLNSVLFTPEHAETPRVECWARLPAPEETNERFLRMLDGQPLLVVTSMPADKLNLFGEKRLRLYRLAADRSRVGHLPEFALETRINAWQSTRLWFTDVDRDGRADLVLGYWKGLKDDRVVLDAYLRLEEGWFSRSPKSTAFDVPEGDRSYLGFGDDLDGDGLPDLLVLGESGLQIHPGDPAASKGKNLVMKKPTQTIPLVEDGSWEAPGTWVGLGTGGVYSGFASGQHPNPVDLDGDGLPEILYTRADKKKATVRLSVISLDRR